MENASKALIIAGAILLSILIIALGVSIYSSTRDTVNKMGDMSEQEITSFNAKFEAYEGQHKSYSQVSSLIDTARTNNNAGQRDQDYSKQVEVVENASFTGDQSVAKASTQYIAIPNTLKNNLKQGKFYTVTMDYCKENGLVAKIGFKVE